MWIQLAGPTTFNGCEPAPLFFVPFRVSRGYFPAMQDHDNDSNRTFAVISA